MNRRQFLLAAATTTAAAVVVPAAPALAQSDFLVGTADSLHPEGIAWEPFRSAFLVGSCRHGTVSVVCPNGTVTTLVSDSRMVSTLGVRVDPVRRRLLVAFADLGVGTRSTPETLYQSSGIGIFDLATGQPSALVPLTSIAGGHVANDIALDPAGTAYVTDAASDGIYRVDRRGQADVLVRDPRFANPTAGLNGIVWHPAGYLLAVGYATGELWRVGFDGTVRAVDLDQPLVGGDGMAVLPTGDLVVVTNGLLGSGVDGVRVLRGDRRWTSARAVRQVVPWPDRGPSTVAVNARGAWVVSGSLDVLFQQGALSDTFSIRRVPGR